MSLRDVPFSPPHLPLCLVLGQGQDFDQRSGEGLGVSNTVNPLPIRRQPVLDPSSLPLMLPPLHRF